MNLRYFRVWSSTWRVSNHIAIELLTLLPERIPRVNMHPVQPYERAASKFVYTAHLLLDTIVSREEFESSTPIRG